MTPGELIGELDSGRAERRITFPREAWYANATAQTDSHVVDEWWLGVDPRDDGGTHGEWSIQWKDLGESRREAWQLQVFGDGLAAMVASDLPDLLLGHEGSDRDTLRAALLAAGWVDRTPRTNPAARGGTVMTLNDIRDFMLVRLRELTDDGLRVSFDEVLKHYGLSRADLDAMDDE